MRENVAEERDLGVGGLRCSQRRTANGRAAEVAGMPGGDAQPCWPATKLWHMPGSCNAQPSLRPPADCAVALVRPPAAVAVGGAAAHLEHGVGADGGQRQQRLGLVCSARLWRHHAPAASAPQGLPVYSLQSASRLSQF